MVPHLQDRPSICKALQLPAAIISSILNFLVRTGLAEQKEDRFICGPTRIHLAESSPLIAKHHTNWRMKAIQSLDEKNKTDLHYSSVMCLSQAAAEKIRELLLQAIQESEPIIKEAENEIVCTLAIDLFGIAGQQ